jgi:hypothetical protein
MNIKEIINQPQIKVETVRKGSDAGRTLLLADLNKHNPVNHIKSLLQKIKDKFIDGEILKIRLDERTPLVFTIVPRLGIDMYRFTISFPEGTEDIQKSLMTGISNFVNT